MAICQKPSSMPASVERLLHQVVLADRGAAGVTSTSAPRAAPRRCAGERLRPSGAMRGRSPRRRGAHQPGERRDRWRRRSAPARSSRPAAPTRRRWRGSRRAGGVGPPARAGCRRDQRRRRAASGAAGRQAARRRRGNRGRRCGHGRPGPPPRALTNSPSRLGVLLDDDGVGALGQGRAGEDAHRLARADACRRRRWPAANSPTTRSRAPGARRVGGAQRIAVHRRDSRTAAGSRRGGDIGARARGRTRRRARPPRSERPAAASTRASASATLIIGAVHGPPPGTRRTCRRTSRQPHSLDAHAAVDRLAHVVDRQRTRR